MAVSSDVKLSIYNGALRRLGSRRLASLTENRKPRRVLDDVWGADAAVKLALEKGEWNFAIRTVKMDYSTSVVPEFGYKRVFSKPADFCRLATLSTSEYFTNVLVDTDYKDEAGYWLTDNDVLYARFVSSGDDFGMDSSKWTESFKEFLEAYLAWDACEAITNSTSKRDRQERDMMKALSSAKSADGMSEGVKFLRRGSWSTARSGNRVRN